MSDQSTDDDKQYEATQTKLDEARKKGDIPRSIDLNTAAAYAGLIVMGLSIGTLTLPEMGAQLAGFLGRAEMMSKLSF